MIDELWPGRGGWAAQMRGSCEYHVATVAGGHEAGYVTLNDADEWVAGVTDKFGKSTVIGSGYPSLHDAKLAVDDARNPPRTFDPAYDDPMGAGWIISEEYWSDWESNDPTFLGEVV